MTPLERAARAAEEIDQLGFSLTLTRLVDGVSTYKLTYDDGDGPFEFDDINDGYAHVSRKRSLARARAVIEAIREPDEAMMVAGCKADDILGELVDWRDYDCTTRETVSRVYKAMIERMLADG